MSGSVIILHLSRFVLGFTEIPYRVLNILVWMRVRMIFWLYTARVYDYDLQLNRCLIHRRLFIYDI